MGTYQITFKVDGGEYEKDYLTKTDTVEADSLDEVAEKTWSMYRQALHHIWKKMEMGIFMAPNPNETVFSIECYRDGEVVNENDVHLAFFEIRRNEFNKLKVKWNSTNI